jgi:hypothetical protein
MLIKVSLNFILKKLDFLSNNSLIPNDKEINNCISCNAVPLKYKNFVELYSFKFNDEKIKNKLIKIYKHNLKNYEISIINNIDRICDDSFTVDQLPGADIFIKKTQNATSEKSINKSKLIEACDKLINEFNDENFKIKLKSYLYNELKYKGCPDKIAGAVLYKRKKGGYAGKDARKVALILERFVQK